MRSSEICQTFVATYRRSCRRLVDELRLPDRLGWRRELDFLDVANRPSRPRIPFAATGRQRFDRVIVTKAVVSMNLDFVDHPSIGTGEFADFVIQNLKRIGTVSKIPLPPIVVASASRLRSHSDEP